MFILLAACGAVACSTSTSSRPKERPETATPIADSVRRGHADVDLTGTWATGSTGEPAVRRIVIRPECNYMPSLWALQQRGDTVRLWMIAESRAQGTRSTQPVSSTTALQGWVSGLDLRIGAAGARYALRYDSTSGHLRGTLNGAPFWAVRQDIVRPGQCIAVP
jgi:hypothetical protein